MIDFFKNQQLLTRFAFKVCSVIQRGILVSDQVKLFLDHKNIMKCVLKLDGNYQSTNGRKTRGISTALERAVVIGPGVILNCQASIT